MVSRSKQVSPKLCYRNSTKWVQWLFVSGFLLIFLALLPLHVYAAQGAIWTTRNDCGIEQQDVNHFACGDIVVINGSGFDPGTYYWYIKGQPGGASCDPMTIVASGTVTVNGTCSVTYDFSDDSVPQGGTCEVCSTCTPVEGTFCFPAYIVQCDDCGEYKFGVGGKNDNYRVPGGVVYRITTTPLSAVNEVGSPHTIVALVQISTDDGANWDALSDVDVTFSLDNNTAGASFEGGVDTDTTDAFGKAEATITASSPGSVDIHAVADIFGDGTYLVATDGTGENSADAEKTYVDARISLTPGSDINQLGDPHEVTALVEINDGGGWVAVDGASVDFSVDDLAGFDSGDPGTTDGTGHCSAIMTRNTAGSYTIHAEADIYGDGKVTCSTEVGGSGTYADAEKTYVDARISLTPGSDINQLGDPHEVTALVEINDGGGWVAVDGASVDFSVDDLAGFDSGDPGTTDGTGHCSAIMTRNTAGSYTIHAEADIYGDGKVTCSTEVGGSGTYADAEKTYVDARISLTPGSDINQLGDPHEVTALVEINDGGGWVAVDGASVDFSVDDLAGFDSGDPGTTDGTGHCSAIMTRNTAGSYTIHAEADIYGDGKVTCSTEVGGSGTYADAEKTYVDARISLTPGSDINQLGDPHEVTALVEINDGGGWVAVDGASVDFSVDDLAGFDSGDPGTTDGTGHCSAIMTRNTAGSYTIHAEADIYGDGKVTCSTEVGGSGTYADAEKTYVDARISLTPGSDINQLGDPHEVTALVEINDGGGWVAVDGASVDFSVDDLAGFDSGDPGTTDGTGHCSAIMTRNTAGSYTIHAEADIYGDGKVTCSTEVGGSGTYADAEKTYVDARISLTPGSDINQLGDPHEVTALVEINDGGGWVAVDGASVDFSVDDLAGFDSGDPGTTDGTGHCSAIMTRNTAGSYTIHAEADIYGDGKVTCSTEVGGSGTYADAEKTYVDARISLTPGSDINQLGDPHEVTALVEINDGGGWVAVDGASVDFSVDDLAGFDSGDPGTTDGTGHCSAIMTRNTAGSYTIHAEADIYGDGKVTCSTEVGGSGTYADAEKTYVDARISLTPGSDINQLGDPHEVTALVEINDGGGWVAVDGASVDFSVDDLAGFDSGDPGTTDGTGHCSAIMTRNTAGSYTIHAEADIYGDGKVTCSTEVGGSGTYADAEKTYVDARISLTPGSDINQLGDPHEVTALVEINDGGGWVAVDGASVDFSVDDLAGFDSGDPGTTDGTGHCSAIMARNTAGSYTIHAEADIYGDGKVTCSTEVGGSGTYADAEKTYVDARISLTPGSDINQLGDPHEVTALVEINDGGGWVAVDGASVDFSVDDLAGFDSGDPGTTDGTGHCSAIMTRNTAGSYTIHAEADIYGDGKVTCSTEVGGSGTYADAEKTYVDARISLTPGSDINQLGDPHEVTALVEINDGGGWVAVDGASVDFSVDDLAGFDSGDPGTTDGTGHCSAIMTRNTAGSYTIHAEADIYGDGKVTCSTEVGGSGTYADAEKTYVDARISLTPGSDINQLGDPHEVTALVEINDGGGWVAVDGASVDFSVDDLAGFDSGDPGTTDGTGHCSAIMTRNTAGSYTIHAEADIYGDGKVTCSTEVGGSGTYADAEKTYVDARISLTPGSDINQLGDPHEVTALVEINDGGGWVAVDGASVDFSVDDLAGFDSGDPGTTDGTGHCSAIMTRNTAGSYTIHAEADIYGDGKVTCSTEVGGSGTYADAEKTYVDARISLTPGSDINQLGDPHEVTALVEINDGGGWVAVDGASVDFSVDDLAGFDSGDPGTTDGTGHCSAIMTRNTAGSYTIHAEADIYGDGKVTCSTEVGGSGTYADAEKTYVDARISLTPGSDINQLGDPHEVTALVEINDGGGWVAVDGASVDFSVDDLAGFDSGDPGTTDGTGHCSAIMTRNTAGSYTIHAEADIYGDGKVTCSTEVGGSGTYADAEKTYVDARISLTPGSDINQLGDPHEVTALVEINDGGGWVAVDGASVDFSVDDLAGFDSGDPGTTDGTGHCSAIMARNTAGSYTIHAEADIYGDGKVTCSTEVGGSGTYADAEKTYITTGIDIEKATNGSDADSGTGPMIVMGANVNWTYVVRNLGSAAVSNVVVTDDNGTAGVPGDDFNPTFTGGDTNTNSKLDPGETWTYEASGTAVAGQYENFATVNADPPVGASVTDNDPSHYYGVTSPEVMIEKATNGSDADSATGPYIAVGGTVTWTYSVSHTGNTALSNVVVTDDNGTAGVPGDDFNPTFTGGDTNTNSKLDPGETWTYEASGTAVAGQYENFATVNADPPVGASVTDNDPSHYYGVTSPEVMIEKATNGSDADSATGPYIAVGGTVTWTYSVSHTGNTALSNVVVTDDNGTAGVPGDDFNPTFTGGDTNTNSKLDPGETWTYEASGTAVAGQYENFATVNADPPVGASVTDNDPSHYFGSDPGITLEKTGTLNDDDGTAGVSAGDTISYVFKVTNTGNVTLSNVTVADKVGGVTVSGGPLASLGVGASDSTTFTGSYAITQADIDAGTFTNTAEATGTPPSGPPVTGEDSDTQELTQSPAIDIEKSTNGQDADSAPGPSIAVGAQITWTYVVTNTGNVTLTNITVTDSDLGAVGTIASLAPGASQTLTKTGTAAAGQYENTGTASVTYNNTPYQDTDDSHYFGAGPGIDIEKATNGQDADSAPGPSIAVGAQITWTYVVTNTGNVTLTNITVTDSDLGAVGTIASLAPGASQTLTKTGTAAAGQYENTGTASVTYNNTPYQDTDDSHYFGAGLGIDIEKATNGQDADSAPGPSIAVGAQITWTYVVTNTGNVTLTNITVTDSDLGAVGTIASLAPGASQTLTKTGTAVAGQYENTGTASVTYNNTPYQDTDDSHYFGAGPGIDIEKATNGQDADSAPGPSIAVGAQITWTYVVTNTGNVTLTNITVTDSDLGAVGTIASLAPGASQTLTKTGTAAAGQYENTGTASVTYNNTPYQDTDDSHYFGAGPGIDIEKATNGQDADSAPGPSIAVGAQITWTYVVTNTGNVTLTNITVTDSDLGAVGTIASLAPGASQTLTKTGTAAAGQYENTGTASVTYNNTPYQDTDDSHYFGAGPGIDIEKATNGQDADSAPGPSIAVGAQITWTYVVTNTGNVTLTNITVTDSDLGAVGTIASLAPGASQTLTKTGTAVAGQYENTGTASVTYNNTPYQDTDDSHYFGAGPGIDIEKSTNGQDADSAPGPSVAVGSSITWSYVVTNTGNVTLTGIQVTDSDLGTVGTIASLLPGASQTLTMTGTAVAGQYANTGTATVIFGDTTYTDSDDSHYFGAGADLSLTKSVDNADPNEGDTIVYTITLTNSGPSDATGVAVTDALPAGLTYVSDNGAGAYSSATNVWTVSSLTNGASVTLAITATVDTGTAGTTIANTAEVTAADQPDSDSTPNNHDPDEDDQSSVSITVQSADLVVDKTVDNPTPNEGDTIVYTITITNDGPSDTTGVTLGDLLPVGVTYVSDNGGGAYDSATGVWTVGSIAVGDIAVLEITATVDAGTAGTTITNTAEVTTSDQPDPDDTNNRDSADITVTEEPAGGGGATEDTCEGRVIINEVAWAGTAADSRDEWIELRNLGTIPVDLTGWTLSWRRKQPTTEEEYRWKVVDLSGILLPASTSACELADNDYTPSVEFIKRDTDDLSWWILGKQEDKDESYYTIERRHDETISNEEANLLYDTTEPYEMELTDLGDVIQLRNDLGEVVDTANASHPERDGWPAGSAATFAAMERTDPLAPDTWENWHTNLGIITRGLDAQEQPLIATADALNSKELEELALNAELPPAKTRAGARLEVGLDLPREDRIALGWPWIRVTQPDLAEAAGGGGAVEAGAGFSFSGRYSGDLYWLGIDTGGLSPGQYNIWVVYGEGKAILVPIVVLP